jgi:hypothetical protein
VFTGKTCHESEDLSRGDRIGLAKDLSLALIEPRVTVSSIDTSVEVWRYPTDSPVVSRTSTHSILLRQSDSRNSNRGKTAMTLAQKCMPLSVLIEKARGRRSEWGWGTRTAHVDQKSSLQFACLTRANTRVVHPHTV